MKAILFVLEDNYVSVLFGQQLCEESVLVVRIVDRFFYFQDRTIINVLVKPGQELLQICLEILQDGESFLKKALRLKAPIDNLIFVAALIRLWYTGVMRDYVAPFTFFGYAVGTKEPSH